MVPAAAGKPLALLPATGVNVDEGTLAAAQEVLEAGKVVHNDEMAADGVTDLDPALDRLAKGYAGGTTAAKSADMESMTQCSSGGSRRRGSAASSSGGGAPSRPAG